MAKFGSLKVDSGGDIVMNSDAKYHHHRVLSSQHINVSAPSPILVHQILSPPDTLIRSDFDGHLNTYQVNALAYHVSVNIDSTCNRSFPIYKTLRRCKTTQIFQLKQS